MTAGTRRVLVTDGDERPALAITRSLARRGFSVIVGHTAPGSLASASRYCERHVVYPSPDGDGTAFQQFLLEFVRQERVDVVIPVTDATTRVVCRHQELLLCRTALAVPPYDAFEIASDKWSLLQHAVRHEVPIPRTWHLEEPGRLEAILGEIAYPAVVKPVRSRTSADGSAAAAKAHYVRSAADLRRLHADALTTFPALIQERVVGPGAGIFVLFDRGRPLAAFAHRRLREKPPSGGVSVLSQSVRPDPRLLRYAIEMLSPLGWHGVAMVEFKRDWATGRWLLLEVNGRYWGSLQLAIDAGVDFPHLACQLALGSPPAPPRPYKVGVKNRWLLGDFDHLLARTFHSSRDLHLPASAPSAARAVLEFLKFVQPGLRYEIADWRDPRPALRELRRYAGALARGITRRVRRSHAAPAISAQSPGGTPPALRVCHVMSADLWAGAEVQLATVASYLAERPEVSVSAVLLNDGRLAQELRALGVPVTVLDEQRHGALEILMRLRQILRHGDVELVHTHRYKDTVLGTLAAKLAGVPHVVRTVHGLNEELHGWELCKFRVYEALDRASLSLFADRIIAVSKRTAEMLEARGYKGAAVTCIHNGVDLRRVQTGRSAEDVRRALGIPPGATLVGTAGRLSPVKGHHSFLRAAHLITQELPDSRFLIAGDGPLRPELEAAATRLGLAGRCLFVGNRSDCYDLMAAMDLFVMPSLDEGLPMAILEAMALGRAVVATAVGGVPEVVRHGDTGLLVPPRDERALADACIELARDAERLRMLGARGRQRVELEFSRECAGRALLETYRDVLGAAVQPRRLSAAVPAGRV